MSDDNGMAGGLPEDETTPQDGNPSPDMDSSAPSITDMVGSFPVLPQVAGQAGLQPDGTYLPHTWKDGEEGGTPITAEALNAIEAALVYLSQPKPTTHALMGSIHFDKWGRFAQVNAFWQPFAVPVVAGHETSLGSTPAGFKPQDTVITQLKDGAFNNIGYLKLQWDGKVLVQSTIDIPQGTRINIQPLTYLTAA